MLTRPVSHFVAMLLCGVLGVSAAWGGGIYLVQGRGLEGQLEIGASPPRGAKKVEGGWFRFADLEFRTANENLDAPVVLIRCQQPACLTDRVVFVGADESEVLRRYGAPQERSGKAREALLRYHGVGFLIREGKVGAIYILPP